MEHFLSWELTFPTSLNQFTEYSQVRLQEPCNRGALKGTHHAMVFL